MAPKDIRLRIPGTCDDVALQGRRGFADVSQLRILSWGIILDYPRGPELITKRGAAASQKQRSEPGDCWLWRRGREHESRHVESLPKWEKARKQILPGVPQDEHYPAGTLILAQWHPFQTSKLQNRKIVNVYGFKPQNLW